jgi:hypothetical protein
VTPTETTSYSQQALARLAVAGATLTSLPDKRGLRDLDPDTIGRYHAWQNEQGEVPA